jgi:uncharacterized MAPEG superfamily protein
VLARLRAAIGTYEDARGGYVHKLTFAARALRAVQNPIEIAPAMFAATIRWHLFDVSVG